MRFHTYTKHSPQAADAVDLEALLEKLADFLLQSGFAGGAYSHPYWGDFGGESDRSLEALKEAILRACWRAASSRPKCWQALRGTETRRRRRSSLPLLDDLVQRLAERGYLNVDAPPRVADGHQPVMGPGCARARRVTRCAVQPDGKGHRLPRVPDATQLLGSFGNRASAVMTRRTSRPVSSRTAGASRTSSATR